MKVILTKKFDFEAAQTVPHIERCKKMHGHSFKIEVSVKGKKDETTGFFCDHALISRAMAPLIKLVDHSYLNEIEGLENPTIENMCGWFWSRLAPHLPGLYEIVIHETPKARCAYRGED